MGDNTCLWNLLPLTGLDQEMLLSQVLLIITYWLNLLLHIGLTCCFVFVRLILNSVDWSVVVVVVLDSV